MDETIGAKGGKNDRRRTMLITKEQYKKLEEHKKKIEKEALKKTEKKIKVIQAKTTAIAVPLVITGTILKELASPKKAEEYVFTSNTQDKTLSEKEPIAISITTQKYSATQQDNKTITKKELETSSQAVEIIEQNHIPIPYTDTNKIFENLKEHEIINHYEQKFKEIKLELKKLIYEYNIIVKEYEDGIYESKVAEELLDKLNIIIEKMEMLKKMIDIPNKEDYDQNYIYNLISEYLNNFENNKLVDDIKDSDLYILISSKLQELDDKKDKLTKDLTDKKTNIKLDEEQFENLKNQYDTFDNFNNLLLRFQADQDNLIRDLETKITNAVSEQEKVETHLRFLQNQSHIILDLIRPQLMIPGVKSGIRLALATASLVHIMRNHIKPRTETKHYRVINVTDYTKDITNSIENIDKSLNLLNKSKKQLRKLLEEFHENYKQYFGQVKECDELLENLKTLLNSLDEKEEELKYLKSEQEKNLENNNEKVKQIKKYELT